MRKLYIDIVYALAPSWLKPFGQFWCQRGVCLGCSLGYGWPVQEMHFWCWKDFFCGAKDKKTIW